MRKKDKITCFSAIIFLTVNDFIIVQFLLFMFVASSKMVIWISHCDIDYWLLPVHIGPILSHWKNQVLDFGVFSQSAFSDLPGDWILIHVTVTKLIQAETANVLGRIYLAFLCFLSAQPALFTVPRKMKGTMDPIFHNAQSLHRKATDNLNQCTNVCWRINDLLV